MPVIALVQLTNSNLATDADDLVWHVWDSLENTRLAIFFTPNTNARREESASHPTSAADRLSAAS